MERDAQRMRGDGPTILAAVKHGDGVAAICDHIVSAQAAALETPSGAEEVHSHGHSHSHGGHGHSHGHSHGL